MENTGLENSVLGTSEEQKCRGVEEEAKTQTEEGNKRPRDHPQMIDTQLPTNAPPQDEDEEEEEKVAKVPKLSSREETAEETKEESSAAPHRPPKPKRRKIAILVVYCGVGYQGMQKNPGAKTIEGDLEEALFKAGAISEDHYGNPKMVDWTRSARTDKGVSAAGQIVSGRFVIEPPGFVSRVNSHLPEQIRVLGFKRVTPSFSAKKFCDRRRYEYVLPVFALDPSAHRDRESVLASEGKEGALVKCLECSERGRKVVGVMGRKNEYGTRGLNGIVEGNVNDDALNEQILGKHNEMALGNVNENEITVEILGKHDEVALRNVNNNEINEKFLGEHNDTALGNVHNNEINGATLGEHDEMTLGNVNNNEINEENLENHEKMIVETLTNNEIRDLALEKCGMVKTVVNNGESSERTLKILDGMVVEAVNDNELNEKTGNPSEMNTGDGVHVASPDKQSNNLESAPSLSGLEQVSSLKRSEPQKVPVGQIDGSAMKSSFCYGEKERDKFNNILKQYVGTHNFHNLTTRTTAEDPSANRYILSFEASDIFTIDGMDFVRCVVMGQSFMLHQIRKMMGLAVAVMRGCAPESIIATALRKDVRMNVPTAPELGLFLDECFFPSYNQKWQTTHEEISLKGFEQQILDFKQKYIYKHIASTEVKDGVVALWLHSLNQRNYPDFIASKESLKLQNVTESVILSPKEGMADTEVLVN
ncbi:tRNA pseudouridine synthase 1 isoform X1 [Cryptomeria japonica]|uniref:tRNA pseudouridine synthase 1 isoform X1 n=1 Tax=Cryptomeria japonica TaxID=3369 RepID=UPI0027DA599A|nr:tRNA pseudouridine synthase 1 isoform X1 [Cryptomeria japonica]